jgi:hypothetical protein
MQPHIGLIALALVGTMFTRDEATVAQLPS